MKKLIDYKRTDYDLMDEDYIEFIKDLLKENNLNEKVFCAYDVNGENIDFAVNENHEWLDTSGYIDYDLSIENREAYLIQLVKKVVIDYNKYLIEKPILEEQRKIEKSEKDKKFQKEKESAIQNLNTYTLENKKDFINSIQIEFNKLIKKEKQLRLNIFSSDCAIHYLESIIDHCFISDNYITHETKIVFNITLYLVSKIENHPVLRDKTFGSYYYKTIFVYDKYETIEKIAKSLIDFIYSEYWEMIKNTLNITDLFNEKRKEIGKSILEKQTNQNYYNFKNE